MVPDSILPDPEMLEVISVQRIGRGLHIEVVSKQAVARCPECGTPAARLHSRYTRYPSDLPICGYFVRLELHVKKYFCQKRECPRKIFCERLPSVLGPHARRTVRLLELMQHVGLLVSGQAAKRIAQAVGVRASRDSFLRAARRYGQIQAKAQDNQAVQVIGLDDWALRKGHSYGTIIIDMERRRPVALLEDRERARVQAWLEQHPNLQVIARDRDASYAEACTWGAPQAEQVADRWHLLRNLIETLERHLARRYPEFKIALKNEPNEAGTQASAPPGVSARLSKPSRRQLEQLAQNHQRRLARFERVKARYAQGWRKRNIARALGLSRTTVNRYLALEQLPVHGNRTRRRPSVLDEHLAYLHERWQSGCRNAARLCRELRDRGYRGSYTSVKEYLALLRQVDGAAIAGKRLAQARLPALRTLAWWLMTGVDKLKPEQASFVRRLFTHLPDLRKELALVRRGWHAIRERQLEAFSGWRETVKKEGFAELKRFVLGLERDLQPVLNALRYHWSNGMSEGHINRLKVIKRSMFGRAKFDLLAAKVFYRP
jgi:transposase